MTMTAVLRRMKRGDLTVHGFRSCFRDWAAELTSYPGELSEAALAHVVGDKVEAAYRRGDLFDKRRDMMAAWASVLRPPIRPADGHPGWLKKTRIFSTAGRRARRGAGPVDVLAILPAARIRAVRRQDHRQPVPTPAPAIARTVSASIGCQFRLPQ